MIPILVTILAGLVLACTNPASVEDEGHARQRGQDDTSKTCIKVIMDEKPVYHCPDIEPPGRPE